MVASEAFNEIVELIASSNPHHIVRYKPSSKTLQRVQALVLKKNEGILAPDEETELQYFLYLENMIGLAKARAYQLLQAAA
ncbi:MAG: hypothetical protein EPO28_06345 [Saprospiraceae bacterium]|nr:MAG: hypothetical protein EPO28_06345 [Saprospiraceae bacterium]